MARQESAYPKVRQALHDLRDANADVPKLFSVWHTAKRVAEKAGCSESTARKYCEQLARCRGYARHRFVGGTYGYRKLEDWAQ